MKPPLGRMNPESPSEGAPYVHVHPPDHLDRCRFYRWVDRTRHLSRSPESQFSNNDDYWNSWIRCWRSCCAPAVQTKPRCEIACARPHPVGSWRLARSLLLPAFRLEAITPFFTKENMNGMF